MRSDRVVEVVGDVAFVPLTKGYTAIIDAADAHLAAPYLWYAKDVHRPDGTLRNVYAIRKGRRGERIPLHRVIAETPAGMETDHINGDGLDNRRANLRHATRSQNRSNQGIPRHNTSGRKGVSWDKVSQKWRASIRVHGRSITLGGFTDINSAADAYAKASAELHGSFGRVS